MYCRGRHVLVWPPDPAGREVPVDQGQGGGREPGARQGTQRPVQELKLNSTEAEYSPFYKIR